MEACVLGVFEVTIRQPYLRHHGVTERQRITETMIQSRVSPGLAKKNVYPKLLLKEDVQFI